MVEVVYDKWQLERIQKMLAGFPGAMRKVVPRAVNATAEGCREDVTDRVTAIRNIRRSSVKNKIKLRKAKAGNWQAWLGISKRRITLMGFGAKWWGLPRTTSAGEHRRRALDREGKKYGKQFSRVVTYNIDRQKYLQHAFIAKGKSGKEYGDHDLVFVRKDLSRTDPKHKDLISLSGPSLGRVVEDAPQMLEDVVSGSTIALRENLNAAVKEYLAGILPQMRGGGAA